MRWYVTINGETVGPVEAETVMQSARDGTLRAGAFVRDEAGGNWTPVEQSPFAAAIQGAVQRGGSEALGTIIVLLPLLATALIWFWVGGMNLLQNPGGSLSLLTIGTIGATAILMAVEASQLGMGSRLDARGKKGSSPIAWFFLSCLLWIVAFPWYLDQRRHYGRRPLIIQGIVIALIFVGSAFSMSSQIEAQKSRLRDRLNDTQNALSQFAAPRAAEPTVDRSPTAMADTAWRRFDTLRGPAFHTKEMLLAHLMQANQAASGLPDDEKAAITRHNAIEYRKRFPTVVVAGEEGRYMGDAADVIIPPGDTARCEKFAKSWQHGEMRTALKEAGYITIRCAGTQNEAIDFPLGPR